MSVKANIQKLVRDVHAVLVRDPLPRQLAVYFHALEKPDWMHFEQLVRFLTAEQGYSSVGPLELLSPPKTRKIFISFDDNYASWHEARRLFDSLNIRVTFYVNTLPFECAAGSAEMDDYYRRLRHSGLRSPLRRDELRQLLADGHTIGAHTHSHPILSALQEHDARSEIVRNKQLLEATLGAPISHFSYPYGQRRHFSESLRKICVREGFITVANGIPGLQHCVQVADNIQRSPWLLHRSLKHNLMNLRIDGRVFERLTGRAVMS